MRIIFFLSALLCAVSVEAAGSQSAASSSDIPPPPNIPHDASDSAPQITIRHHGSEKVEEYRANGRLYMIRITPAGGKPYYLIDNKGDGQFVRRDMVQGNISPPMWVLHQW
jgi:hypothetical protein